MSIPHVLKSLQEAAGAKAPPASQAPAVFSPASPQPAKFTPPYLRYDIPEENEKIQAALAARRKRLALKQAPQSTSASALNIGGLRAVGGVTEPPPGVIRRQPVNSRSAEATRPRAAPAAETTQAKAAASNMVVVPSGTVEIGFWCDTQFRASTNISGIDYEWRLELDGGYSYWLGSADGPDVDFVLDGETYKLAAYYAKGSAKLTVHCAIATSLNQTFFATSDPILLKFSQSTPCLELHSVVLSTTSVKGGDQNREVTLTVALSGPAGPSGQEVILSTNDPGRAWIMGNGSFTIPAGQTSGELSWFLGTRRVLKDHNVIITAEVNGKPGYVHVKITK